MQPAAIGRDALEPNHAARARHPQLGAQGILDLAEGRAGGDQLLHQRLKPDDRLDRPADQLAQLVELVAVGATEAGIDQQRAEVAGVEQPARVFFRRRGGAQFQHRLLARRAAKQRRHIAQHTHIEDRMLDMRRHARVGRLGEEAPEAIANQRRARPQQRVAVMIEDRNTRKIDQAGHRHLL